MRKPSAVAAATSGSSALFLVKTSCRFAKTTPAVQTLSKLRSAVLHKRGRLAFTNEFRRRALSGLLSNSAAVGTFCTVFLKAAMYPKVSIREDARCNPRF
jgi:hypothetical protein